nr:ATP-binding protein [Neotabrizicola shimadae]
MLSDAAGSPGGGALRQRLLLAAAVGAGALAFVSEVPSTRWPALAAALTLLLILTFVSAARVLSRWQARRQEGALRQLVQNDAALCLITDALGEIGWHNTAAEARLAAAGGNILTLAGMLNDHFANPGAVLFRLQRRAESGTPAREDVVTRRGHLRLSATPLPGGRFLWRIEEFLDRGQPGRGGDSLSLPMLVVNRAGVVLYANEALRRLAGSRPKRLDRLFTDPAPLAGEVVTVSGADGPVRALLAEIAGPGDRREIYLVPVPDRPAAAPATFEDLPVALLRLDGSGTVLTANRAARELAGLSPDSLSEMHEIYEGLGRPVADWLGDAMAGRLPEAAEVLKLRAGEGERFHHVALRRIVEDGRPGLIAVLTDATDVKTLEAQVTQGQKMQAIGLLAGGIAHDFNNLLTAISGHCDLLLLRHDLHDPDYEDLVQIRQNAYRAAGLVGQLLSYSRRQTLKPERIDLPEVLADITHLLNRLVGERISLSVTHDPVIGAIRADRRHFEQIVVNLVVNARDAMPLGGTIRIETEAVALAEPLQRDRATVPVGDWSVIRVCDTGTGMSQEVMARIFEPFFTTKRPGEGTGLGLANVYGIVKQSGGFIFVDSTPGEGTCFTLYFPLHRGEEPRRAEAPAETAPPRIGQGVVLLVEDEAPVRTFASRALRMRGFTVIEAASAEDALKRLDDPALEVDVFVTDVVMPGMDGPSWVRKALEDRPNVRVIFVSGYAEDSLAEDQLRIPNSVFLPKPFSLNDLTTTVHRQMH